jgi:hypothetical protein
MARNAFQARQVREQPSAPPAPVDIDTETTDELLADLRRQAEVIEAYPGALARRDAILAVLIGRSRTEVPMDTLIEASGKRRAMVYRAAQLAKR